MSCSLFIHLFECRSLLCGLLGSSRKSFHQKELIISTLCFFTNYIGSSCCWIHSSSNTYANFWSRLSVCQLTVLQRSPKPEASKELEPAGTFTPETTGCIGTMQKCQLKEKVTNPQAKLDLALNNTVHTIYLEPMVQMHPLHSRTSYKHFQLWIEKRTTTRQCILGKGSRFNIGHVCWRNAQILVLYMNKTTRKSPDSSQNSKATWQNLSNSEIHCSSILNWYLWLKKARSFASF